MSAKNPTRGIPDIRGVNIYTDGSKDSNSSGAGVVIREGGNTTTNSDGGERIYSYNLGKNTTVFQSEVFAQKMAATLITAPMEASAGLVMARSLSTVIVKRPYWHLTMYGLNPYW